jgi:hypothetical protein
MALINFPFPACCSLHILHTRIFVAIPALQLYRVLCLVTNAVLTADVCARCPVVEARHAVGAHHDSCDWQPGGT